jgi:Skp family chaperone for outer membrane proteins
MNFKLSIAATVILTVSVVASYGQTSTTQPPAKKHVATMKAKSPAKSVEVPKTRAAAPPTVEEQIQALRRELEGQINSLRNDLASKDEQLQKAQQAAADARAAAARAEAQQQAVTENAAAVSTLQSAVTDLKGSQASLATKVTEETEKIKKDIANPSVLHYKGITLSPMGSFIAGETVWRQGAVGGGINTPFTGVPLQYSDAAQMSEFQGSGRQSRLALTATGKLENMTITGFYEMDWLGTGITSNNNESNSYVLRQRQLWARAALKSGWSFVGGQMWSLTTETTRGLENGSEILPAVIDPQYAAGFAWSRQYGFRVTKAINHKIFVGVSAENAETLNPAGSNLPTNLLIGSAGVGGGLYNPTANYSFNPEPDFVAKVAFEPGWGHWELFGLSRSFRDRIYPNAPSSSTGAYNNTKMSGAIGGGFRGPLLDKKVMVGLKGLWGQGVGRYGSSTIADVTLRPDGTISPLHGFSALSSVDVNPTPRLNIYMNYGGDYIGRDYTGTGSTAVGYGIPGVNMSGCNTEPVSGGSFSPSTPAGCGANNKDVQEFTAGYWYDIYKGPMGRLRQGLQYAYFARNLWSGAGGTTNPGGSAGGTDNMFWTSLRYYLP